MAPNIQVYILISLWIEVLIYGIYATLFMGAVYIMLTKYSASRLPSKVFLWTITLMFVIVTFHIIVNVYRLVRAYGVIVKPEGPMFYFQDLTLWDNFAHTIVVCLITWVGDALVIYRCWIIWGGNWYVIILPTLLWFWNVGMNSMILHWFVDNFATYEFMHPWLDAIYPLLFVENVMTTGLIVFKLWQQHREAVAAGISEGATSGIMGVMRIVVESAAVYTLQLLILIVLYFTNHPAQYIVQSAIIPSIGIVFVLIAIRVHLAKSKGVAMDATTSMIPGWLGSSKEQDVTVMPDAMKTKVGGSDSSITKERSEA